MLVVLTQTLSAILLSFIWSIIMKIRILFILLCISVIANAQKGISYQAVILDPAAIELPGSDIMGQPLVNGNVWIKFAINSGTTTQFEEVQETKTDAYGLVNLTIGSVASTAFNAVTWDATQKSLQVFVSFNNGASYTKVSDQKLTYSPYALFAETAGKLASTLQITGGGTGATTAVAARANLGLGNVDNTADASKPISAAMQTALDLKANAADVNSALDLKASAAMLAAHMAITVDTSMLATKAALTDLNNYAPKASPTFTGTVSGITKSMVGLGFVDNTTDAAKPISTATQAALNSKVNNADLTLALSAKASLNSPVFSGLISAGGYKIPNGTSSQYLMADGTVSSSGGGSSIQSGVDLTTNQTIGGVKTFSSDLSVSAKLGVGTATPNASSSLDIATALPIILPKMNQSQISAISAPVASMLQFNTTSKKMQVYKESVASTSSVFGNTTLSNGATCLRGSGELWFRPTTTGTITQIELNAFGAGEVASLVINSNYSGGSPTSTLLGASNSITAVDGWNTWTFSTPVNVVANTTYFITSTDANRCLGVRWSNSGDDATTGNVSNMGYGNPLNSYDPASRITVVVPATNGWVNLRDDVATTNLSTDVTNILPLTNGGTGSSTKNFVDLSSAQTVAGAKSFSGNIVVGASAATGTSAALEIKSTTQGLLLPRLTTTQRDAINTPLVGLLIYNSTAGKMQGYTEASGTASTLANTGSTGVGLGIGYDYNICLSFTPTSNWRVSSVSIGVQSVYASGNLTLSLYIGVPGSGTLLGSQTVATSTLSGGFIAFNFSSPISVPQGSCYWKISADNTADLSLPRLGQFNDGVNEGFTALRNNNAVIVNIPSYSFPFSMAYTPLTGAWADLH